jgi:hypothetical protein
MKNLSLDIPFQDLALLATVLNKELTELEQECPDELQDEDSYAYKIKLLHRRILSLHS